jgi:hypothetical protein
MLDSLWTESLKPERKNSSSPLGPMLSFLRPKNCKTIGDLNSKFCCLGQKVFATLVFKKNANYFSRKLVKIAENKVARAGERTQDPRFWYFHSSAQP